MRLLTVTNMYPTDADPTYGTFVGDEVVALRSDPRVAFCEVQFIDGRSDRLNYLRAVGRLRHAIGRGRPDVVHAHHGLAGAVAVTQRSVPVVITYHTGDLEMTRWQRFVSRRAYRLAQDNICVSRRAMAQLPGPAHHITCGVDTDLFAPVDRGAARARFAVADDALAVLFPSSPARTKKAYPRFVEVLERLRGRGARVHELQLMGLPREQVPALMAAADVMLLTSIQEGSPVAVMEALACGLGVVATAVGDIPSMLEGARNAYCSGWDAGAFTDAVLAVAAADRGRPRVPDPRSAAFAARRVLDQLIAVLAQAAGGG